MTILTHILVTTAGVQALKLRPEEIPLAYVFGVLLDLDHLIKIPLFLKKHNFKIRDIFKKSFPREKHYNWRTSLQEPIALLWILPLCAFLNSFVPIVFFLGHLFLDYLMSYQKFPFYPLSNFTSRGFFTATPDKIKEAAVVVIAICLILLQL